MDYVQIQQFIMNNLQTITAVGGGIGAVIFITKNKNRCKSNRSNLSRFHVKLNRQNEALRKRTESIF